VVVADAGDLLFQAHKLPDPAPQLLDLEVMPCLGQVHGSRNLGVAGRHVRLIAQYVADWMTVRVEQVVEVDALTIFGFSHASILAVSLAARTTCQPSRQRMRR